MTATTTHQDNIALVRRLMDEGFNQANLAVCDELFSPDAVDHQPGNPPGAEGVKVVIHRLRTAFSDFRIEIEDIVAAEDTVWFRNRATGTNDGPFMWFPPTGRSIDITVYDQVRVEDGRIVEHWGVPDRMQVALQLGHLSPPPRSEANVLSPARQRRSPAPPPGSRPGGQAP